MSHAERFVFLWFRLRSGFFGIARPLSLRILMRRIDQFLYRFLER